MSKLPKKIYGTGIEEMSILFGAETIVYLLIARQSHELQ